MNYDLPFNTVQSGVTSVLNNERVIAGIITATIFIGMLAWVPALNILAAMIRRGANPQKHSQKRVERNANSFDDVNHQ